jgi:pimeloyl-ACP methyl ester carboxylesterase
VAVGEALRCSTILGAERASIDGMGLGSTIAARAAAAHPERFDVVS